jgi:hypothetical protein
MTSLKLKISQAHTTIIKNVKIYVMIDTRC